jgi:hypothetical protein
MQTEDGLTHIEWYQRSETAALPEDDIVVFPQEATFAQVVQHKSNNQKYPFISLQ